MPGVAGRMSRMLVARMTLRAVRRVAPDGSVAETVKRGKPVVLDAVMFVTVPLVSATEL